MNSLITVLDSEYDPISQTFKATGYEWK
jgi:hypothetical protein